MLRPPSRMDGIARRGGLGAITALSAISALSALAVAAPGQTPPAAAPAPAAVALSLEQAYDLALASDQSIRIAYWEVRKANLLPWSALTRLGPQIYGDGSYSRDDRTVRQEQVTGYANPEEGSLVREEEVRVVRDFSRADTARAGLSYEQPLIDFTVFPAYRYGKLTGRASRLEHRFTVRGVLFGVAQAYFEVLKQERVLAVNRQTLALAEEQRDVAGKRADVGEVTRADVLRATVAVETARRALIESENLLLFRRNTLANIVNLDPAADLRLSEPPRYPRELPPFESLLAQAYAGREDLRVADLAIEREIALRGEVVGRYGPRVVAGWDGDLAALSGTGPWSHVDRWGASVSVQVPVFTGGQREIDLMAADRTIRQSRLAREAKAKEIQQEVKQAWLTVRALDETLKALAAQVEAAAQGYSDLDAQYRGGTATSVDVLAALNDLNAARRDLAVETYAYEVALRNLEQVRGAFQEARAQSANIR